MAHMLSKEVYCSPSFIPEQPAVSDMFPHKPQVSPSEGISRSYCCFIIQTADQSYNKAYHNPLSLSVFAVSHILS